jgi:hypothetical protein
MLQEQANELPASNQEVEMTGAMSTAHITTEFTTETAPGSEMTPEMNPELRRMEEALISHVSLVGRACDCLHCACDCFHCARVVLRYLFV